MRTACALCGIGRIGGHAADLSDYSFTPQAFSIAAHSSRALRRVT
jgi:hypothetical protein